MGILYELKIAIREACSITLTLLKIMIPISIAVKILAYFGFIEIIGKYLAPLMNTIGLPGEFGLVWATALFINIYGALIVFFNLSLNNIYTVAQVTVLACLMLLAHTLPIEARIAQKAGVRLWFTILFRLSCAILLGLLLNLIFSTFNLLQSPNTIAWQPSISNPTVLDMIIGEVRNYLMIFLIILLLMIILKILKNTGSIDKIKNFLKPGLKKIGLSENAAHIVIVGSTLGLAYGGGLIIKESKGISKKDVFYSLSLLDLSHSLIEDTLLTLSIGASIFFILFARIAFAILILIILIKIIDSLSKKTFERFFMNH